MVQRSDGVCRNRSLEAFDATPRRRRLVDRREISFGGVAKYLDEQLCFGRIVAIQSSRRNTGAIRNGLHRRGCIAAFFEKIARGRNEALASNGRGARGGAAGRAPGALLHATLDAALLPRKGMAFRCASRSRHSACSVRRSIDRRV